MLLIHLSGFDMMPLIMLQGKKTEIFLPHKGPAYREHLLFDYLDM